MLFRAPVLRRIADGSVTLAFRCWKRPTVRAGSTLRTPIGVLAVDAVDEVDADDVSDADARAAGAPSRQALLEGLRCEEGRALYRIRVRRVGDDPRVARREDDRLGDAERAEIDGTLRRWDARGPWTRATLEIIDRRPGVVSTSLAEELGVERQQLKRRVRRLKELGLTESLDVGYRLSPRGVAYLEGPV